MRPAIVVPDEFCASAAEIFRPVDPDLVPEIADVLRYLAEHHPLSLAAVADVDRTLIWSAMEETALEKLANCSRNARGIEGLRAAMKRDRKVSP